MSDLINARTHKFTQEDMEVLAELIHYGPSKTSEIQRNYELSGLIVAGCVASIIVKCESDFVAATYEGMRVLCRFYEGATTIVKAVEACQKVMLEKMAAQARKKA
jgi:hypothetical protein